MNKIFLIIIFFVINCNFGWSQSKKNGGDIYKSKSQRVKKNDKYDHNKVARSVVERPKRFLGIFNREENKLDCPDKSKKRPDNPDVITVENNTKANIVRSSNSVHFDVVQLDDIHLDIPAFKLFRNNMTDFTADGEQEFHEIVLKIAVFLGTNHEGKGVTLKIIGSASQIPTSFDPQKPNNNINPDGSSIAGRTNIANNRMLAKARADQLAKKINEIFPSITIDIPKLEDIQLGSTKWTDETQRALNEAVRKKDKAAIQNVYEPFQKDQWVKVESKERTRRIVQPESIKMYLISTTPYLKTIINGEDLTIKSVFIVSKNTFEEIGDHHTFKSVDDRDMFLKKMGLQIFSNVKNGITRWYLLKGSEERVAFETPDYTERVYSLFSLGIVDNMDEQILEEKIIADVRKENKID